MGCSYQAPGRNAWSIEITIIRLRGLEEKRIFVLLRFLFIGYSEQLNRDIEMKNK